MESSLKKKGKIVLGISVAALILGALATGIFGPVLSLLQTRTISNIGSVKGIGVGIYWDPACTNRTSTVNWGFLEPGSGKTVIVYVRNEGSVAVTLSVTAQNWSPSAASSYMTLKWDYAGQTLSVNQVLQVKLSLVVSQDVSGITDFSFDLTITTTG